VTQAEVDEKVQALGLDGSSPSSKVRREAFIDGAFVKCYSGETFDSENPATGKVVAKLDRCGEREVELAVTAARRSFQSGVWSAMDPRERMEILFKFADLIAENALELAVLDCIEAGKPIRDCIDTDLPDTMLCIRFHAEAIDKMNDEITPTGPGHLAMIVREPIGVCALITPWNFPVAMAGWKVGPCLATGNSLVLKPAELTSLSALRLAELAFEAGVPAGVFNVVPGIGPEAGSALAKHPDVDSIHFTGSTMTGKLILQESGKSNMKHVSLETGGKSPQIVFEDVDNFDKACDNIVSAAFWNQSENCSCGSRLIVQNSIKEKVLAMIQEKVEKEWKIGDPVKLSTKIGSMISKQHAAKVHGFIERAKADGAKLVATFSAEGLDETRFVPVTIFENVRPDSELGQEEVFGPVLAVMPFETEEEAIQIANNSKYGLAASVYTSNVNRAHRVARAIRAGNVSINCFAEGNHTTPFGGFKQSGFVGRDKSLLAHAQYQEIKTVWFDLSEK